MVEGGGNGANSKSCYFFTGTSVGVKLTIPWRRTFHPLVKILVWFQINKLVIVAKVERVENEKK